jgi:hypothetical protein
LIGSRFGSQTLSRVLKNDRRRAAKAIWRELCIKTHRCERQTGATARNQRASARKSGHLAHVDGDSTVRPQMIDLK